MSKIIFGFFLLLAGLKVASADAKVHPHAIYGEDDRKEVFEVNSVDAELAESTVAMIPRQSLMPRSDGMLEHQGKSFGETFKLCPGERFFTQRTAAYCSGFLVAPDMIATAGHCVQEENSCLNNVWVFGYHMTNPQRTQVEFSEEQVYNCARVIRFKVTKAVDYALVQLDRPVTVAKPLSVPAKAKVEEGDPVMIIGHPSGLPTKVAGNARVIEPLKRRAYFSATLDAFGGNSGSAVFNSETRELLGILVRGEDDFVTDKGCRRARYCSEGECRGEEVTDIRFIYKALQETQR